MTVTVTNQIIVDDAGNWVSLEEAARLINEHAKLKALLLEMRGRWRKVNPEVVEITNTRGAEIFMWMDAVDELTGAQNEG